MFILHQYSATRSLRSEWLLDNRNKSKYILLIDRVFKFVFYLTGSIFFMKLTHISTVFQRTILLQQLQMASKFGTSVTFVVTTCNSGNYRTQCLGCVSPSTVLNSICAAHLLASVLPPQAQHVLMRRLQRSNMKRGGASLPQIQLVSNNQNSAHSYVNKNSSQRNLKEGKNIWNVWLTILFIFLVWSRW